MSSQVNIKKQATFNPPPTGFLAFGFDQYGNPCRVNADGSYTIISLVDQGESNGAAANILANKGVGLEANLPTTFVVNDVYVSTDTNRIFTAVDSATWSTSDLIESQLVTDTSADPFILYQYVEGTLVGYGVLTLDQITALNEMILSRTYTQEPTGFTNNANITISYNSTTRKVTLNGTFKAYYQGTEVAELVDGWESEAHPNTEGNYFLLYNGTAFEFVSNGVTFSDLFIAYVQYKGVGLDNMAIRETHGFMQNQTHKEFHETIGTYMTSGGDVSSYVLASNVVAERRPEVSNTTVNDEDLQTIIPSLTDGLYTHRYLEGSEVRTLNIEQADIIALDGNRPYYNENVGGTWQQTLFPLNAYGAIFIVGIPVTSDVESQKYRYMWVQSQQVSTNLADIQALTSNSLVHGKSTALVSEFVFFGKIIIQYKSGNWEFTSVEKITGTRINQVATPAGNYLSTVASNDTIEGDGTSGNPLGVTGIFYNIAKTFKGIFNFESITDDRTFSLPDISGLIAVFGMLNPFKFGRQVWVQEHIQTWSAATNFNLNNGNTQSAVVDATSTITITNKQLGGQYNIDLKIDAIGGYTLTFDGSFGDIDSNGESSPLTVSANERYFISVSHTTNGTLTIITKIV